MVRVANLYRVSTKGQVDKEKNDIPMQRIACREFAEKHGWTIVMEKEELGVSGYKVSATKRDAIQELKEAATRKEFDILLVFMFDRLGRIDNETPFILEWFIQNGIEMWSVKEGQQKIESHGDKLMNYIRFWQASGESEKTSIRVKTRLSQMTSDGIYTGGVVPFGYRMVDKGRKNKKGLPVKDLEIDPVESAMARKLFSKVITEGYGSHQLATYLNENGFRTRKNSLFQANNIRRILRNPIYSGYLVRGESKSDLIPELQIVSERDFAIVQDILEQRSRKNDERRTVSLNNQSRELLSGNVFCAHCGCRLTGSRRISKKTNKDGTETKTDKGTYVCYHRSRGLNECDGQTTYYAEKVDRAVLETMRFIFSNVAGCPEEEKIKEAYRNSVLDNITNQKRLVIQIEQDTSKLELLQEEIVKTLTGESVYTPEELKTAMVSLKSKIESNEQLLDELKEEEAEKRKMSESIIPAYRQFRTWASEFDECSFRAKKMIVSQMFSRIEIGKGYKLHFEMNFTYKQFCSDWMTMEKKINACG